LQHTSVPPSATNMPCMEAQQTTAPVIQVHSMALPRTNTFVCLDNNLFLVRPSRQQVLLGVLFLPIVLTGQVCQMKSR
jgi:hypothetical protein